MVLYVKMVRTYLAKVGKIYYLQIGPKVGKIYIYIYI